MLTGLTRSTVYFLQEEQLSLVESYIGVTESGCTCVFVYWLFGAAMFSMSMLREFSF
mgnify:CR=1 FL=1